MANDNNITGNQVVSSDFVKVLLAVKDSTLKDCHTLELGIVKEINDNKIMCDLLSNPSIKVQAIKINSSQLTIGELVLIGFNDNDFKTNLNRLNSNEPLQETDSKEKHKLTNGIIISSSKGGSGILYPTIGDNTDGAITQKGTTDQLNLKASKSELNLKVDKTDKSIIFATQEYEKSKNLLNVAGLKSNINLTNFKVDYDNQTIRMYGNSANANTYYTISVKPNTNYYIKCNYNAVTQASGTGNVSIYPSDMVSSIARFYGFDGVTQGTFNTGNNTTINVVLYANSSSNAENYDVTFLNIQLEEGTSATAWVFPYGEIVRSYEPYSLQQQFTSQLKLSNDIGTTLSEFVSYMTSHPNNTFYAHIGIFEDDTNFRNVLGGQPTDFLNYTTVTIRRISDNDFELLAHGWHVQMLAKGHIFDDRNGWYFTGWDIIMPRTKNTPLFYGAVQQDGTTLPFSRNIKDFRFLAISTIINDVDRFSFVVSTHQLGAPTYCYGGNKYCVIQAGDSDLTVINRSSGMNWIEIDGVY